MSRGLRLTEAQARQLGVKLPSKPAPRTDEPNATERAYIAELDRLVLIGELRGYRWQPGSLRLAPSTHYRPDALVAPLTGPIEVREVKGRKGDGFYAREDAWLRVKLAAALFPWFRFVIVWPLQGGGWGRRVVPSA